MGEFKHMFTLHDVCQVPTIFLLLNSNLLPSELSIRACVLVKNYSLFHIVHRHVSTYKGEHVTKLVLHEHLGLADKTEVSTGGVVQVQP
jgi:hypothetical protein